MENHEKSKVKDLSLEFSLLLIEFSQKTIKNKAVSNSNQWIRSGTSIGAMIREAQGAESRNDFIHKMKIAFKEAEETEYWLIIVSKNNPMKEIDQLLDILIQLKKMLSKIIATTIKNNQLRNK